MCPEEVNILCLTASNMNKLLWDTKSNDHYITQVNPDGSTRDKVVKKRL